MTITKWGQTESEQEIIKGLADYLERAKDIIESFVMDLRKYKTELENGIIIEDNIAQDDYYLIMVNIIDIFNGIDYSIFMEDINMEDLKVTEKGKELYTFIKDNYKDFDNLDIRLSIDNNAMEDTDIYKPTLNDYNILNGLLEILKK